MRTQTPSGINLHTVKQRLQEAGLPFSQLTLQDGLSIILWQRGGRIFGPFIDEDTPSIGWMSQAFNDPRQFQALIERGEWNVGGTRAWISPELQFHISNRFDFDGSYSLPAALDPGNYSLEQVSSTEFRLSQRIQMDTRILATGTKRLYLEQKIRIAADPLRKLPIYPELKPAYRFGGFEQAFTLVDEDPNPIYSAVWTLMQLQPGGDLLIPTSIPEMVEFYRNPVAEPYLYNHPGYAQVKLTGSHQFKLAYYAAGLTGRLGYIIHTSPQSSTLIVRNYFNNPSAEYAEEPPTRPGINGQSVYVYNDDGALGGFGELECQGQSVGGPNGLRSVSEQMQIWYYTGQRETIGRITQILLGIPIL
ncbi:hypothetical protein ADN00_14840 [Ornatilinea apprima]|uniref:Uncharacterized protein n=1 Tax=Ornatilinea apprima TaxID=1134406 RepID=A0A0P6XCW5_9CHLR|nr:hypothetical protein [Ornatilinea apprima]KPL73067.1 hypothetical protein ADN00_14840 [Ornatilinea apprima]